MTESQIAALLQQTTSVATQASTKIDQHLIECTRSSAETSALLRDIRMETSASIRRLHERMDENFKTREEQFDRARRDARNMLIAIATLAVTTLIAILPHFWK